MTGIVSAGNGKAILPRRTSKGKKVGRCTKEWLLRTFKLPGDEKGRISAAHLCYLKSQYKSPLEKHFSDRSVRQTGPPLSIPRTPETFSLKLPQPEKTVGLESFFQLPGGLGVGARASVDHLDGGGEVRFEPALPRTPQNAPDPSDRQTHRSASPDPRRRKNCGTGKSYLHTPMPKEIFIERIQERMTQDQQRQLLTSMNLGGGNRLSGKELATGVAKALAGESESVSLEILKERAWGWGWGGSV